MPYDAGEAAGRSTPPGCPRLKSFSPFSAALVSVIRSIILRHSRFGTIIDRAHHTQSVVAVTDDIDEGLQSGKPKWFVALMKYDAGLIRAEC